MSSESPLKQAHDLARKADIHTLNQDFASASRLHGEAAAKFEQAVPLTTSTEAQKMLHLLVRQHNARATMLATQRPVVPGAGTSRVVASVQDDLAMSLASARGIHSPAVTAGAVAVAKNSDDSLHKLYQTVNSTFQKTLQATIAKEEAKNKSVAESYYIVGGSSAADPDAAAKQALNRASIQLHAHETAAKRQREVLKSGLVQLRTELAAREAALRSQYEAELDKLRSENDKLKIQNTRLKSRWAELKQNARRRRDDE